LLLANCTANVLHGLPQIPAFREFHANFSGIMYPFCHF
jgi:hypothetical protein